MVERSFISGISELIDNVGKCKCYDDARNLLNSFVIENVGKHYETEDGTTYRNSNNPKDIKAETLRVLDDYVRKRQVVDESSTAGLNTARKIMDKKNVIYDDGTIISIFGNMRTDIEKSKSYIDAWQKEPVPVVKKKEYRLRPKDGKEHYIDTMFVRLQELGYLSKDENKDKWRYLCGTNDDAPSEPIKWHGSFFDFCVLFDFFLVSSRMSCIFGFEKGVQGFVVSMFGYEADTFKSRLSRDYKPKPEKDKKEIWNKMKDPQMLFT